MDKKEALTYNIKIPNKDLQALKTHFSDYFDKNGNFDFEKFKRYLTQNEVCFSTESYGLEWLGKSYARFLACNPATTLLKADTAHNSKPENIHAQNLLIKGDNLEVLKHLTGAYYEKIKMIYIDPPYNTGSDGFVYQDNRKFTVQELKELAGIDEERAKRILEFAQSKSNSHSAWLTFMYPRLYIAHQLLCEDGIIFISIDDNEIAQLRLLMDEIFGEKNFVAIYKWNKTSTPPSLSKKVRQKYEFVLCYEKNNSKEVFDGGTIDGGDMPLLNESNSIGILRFKADVVHFRIDGTFQKGTYDRVELLDDIIVKNGKANTDFRLKGPFKWKQDHLNYEITSGTVFHIKSDKFAIRYERQGERIKVPADVISKTECGVGTNEDANKELFNLFHQNGLFNYPKPSSLLKYLIKFKTKQNDLILDFFAGSGTTGDAVMQLNAEDGGSRKFILVQLPELIDPKKNKTAHDFVKNELKAEPTIFEITKERLLRAAKKINAELDEKIAKLKKEPLTQEKQAEIQKLEQLKTQNTFKIFETVPIWNDYYFEAEFFDSSQTLFDADKLTPQDLEVLLLTWKTYDGIPLTQDLEPVDLGGYTAYYGNGKLYLIHKDFKNDNLLVLLQKVDDAPNFEPHTIIAFGYYFDSARTRELAESLKHNRNKKHTDIEFIVRY